MARSAIRGRHSGSHSFHPGHMLLVDSTGPDHGLTLVAEVFTKIEYYTFICAYDPALLGSTPQGRRGVRTI